jgi:hypothetical protein
VDCGEGVGAGREVGDVEGAIGGGDGEPGVGRDVDESAHPGVVVAADGEHDLGGIESFGLGGGVGWLGDVDGGVARLHGHGVDVVDGGVGVEVGDGATLLHCDDVRDVAAAFLVECDGWGIGHGGVAGCAGFDVDVDVGEVVVVDDVLLSKVGQVGEVAGGIGGHVDGNAGGGVAVEVDYAGDGAGGGWVDGWCGVGDGFGGGRGGGGGLAAGEGERREKKEGGGAKGHDDPLDAEAVSSLALLGMQVKMDFALEQEVGNIRFPLA